MPAPYVTAEIAAIMERQGRPWRVRIEYHGANSANQSNRSDKWWEIYGHGTGAIACNFGAMGSKGRAEPFMYMLGEALLKLSEKRSRGYAYVPGTLSTLPAQHFSDLPSPYRNIRKVVKVEEGLYAALDSNGGFLMHLDADGAEEVCRMNPWIHVGSQNP
jgi:hypothetical protein